MRQINIWLGRSWRPRTSPAVMMINAAASTTARNNKPTRSARPKALACKLAKAGVACDGPRRALRRARVFGRPGKVIFGRPVVNQRRGSGPPSQRTEWARWFPPTPSPPRREWPKEKLYGDSTKPRVCDRLDAAAARPCEPQVISY